MPGLHALSIDPETYTADFLEDLFFGAFYHQHLGEAYAGLSTSANGRFQIRSKAVPGSAATAAAMSWSAR